MTEKDTGSLKTGALNGAKAKTPVYIIVIWAVLGLAVLASFVAMIYFGVKTVAGGGRGSGEQDTREYTVPEILPREDTPDDLIYVDPDGTDLIRLIDVRTVYSAELTCANLADGRLNYDIYWLERKGSVLRAEIPSKTVEFDGSILYVKTELYSYTVPAEEKDFYLELGTASLDEVLQLAREPGSDIQLSMNDKIIVVTSTDSEHGISHYYEISLEYGLVTYEIHYIGDTVYRLNRIQNIDVFPD